MRSAWVTPRSWQQHSQAWPCLQASPQPLSWPCWHPQQRCRRRTAAAAAAARASAAAARRRATRAAARRPRLAWLVGLAAATVRLGQQRAAVVRMCWGLLGRTVVVVVLLPAGCTRGLQSGWALMGWASTPPPSADAGSVCCSCQVGGRRRGREDTVLKKCRRTRCTALPCCAVAYPQGLSVLLSTHVAALYMPCTCNAREQGRCLASWAHCGRSSGSCGLSWALQAPLQP